MTLKYIFKLGFAIKITNIKNQKFDKSVFKTY